MQTRSFASGDAFLADCEALDPGVLLLDFQMRGATGIDVLRHVATQPQLRFATIMVTGEANIELAVHAMKAGAIDFLEKPYRAETLGKCIDLAFSTLKEGTAIAEREAQARSAIKRLSPRERDVLIGLLDGHQNKSIANKLAISTRTVEIYRANLMTKLDVRSLADALKIAFVAGLFRPTTSIRH